MNDLISRQEVIDTIHGIIYDFFDKSDGPMNDKDKLLLVVNKAICDAIRNTGQKTKTDIQ